MEQSISGFTERGEWRTIVEHGERISNALQEAGACDEYPDEFEEWTTWRPKHHEDLDSDVSEKTAEQASASSGDTEPNEELQKAGERIADSYEKLNDGDGDEAVSEWRGSMGHVVKAVDSARKKTVEAVEKTVYEKVMTRVSPYYFDNQLVSANIVYKRSQNEFVFEVNINDEDIKDPVATVLEQLEDDVERWHVNTEKRTDAIESAEGVEPSESSKVVDEENPQPTTN